MALRDALQSHRPSMIKHQLFLVALCFACCVLITHFATGYSLCLLSVFWRLDSSATMWWSSSGWGPAPSAGWGPGSSSSAGWGPVDLRTEGLLEPHKIFIGHISPHADEKTMKDWLRRMLAAPPHSVFFHPPSREGALASCHAAFSKTGAVQKNRQGLLNMRL